MKQRALASSGRVLLADPGLRMVFGVSLMVVLGVSAVTPAFPRVAQALGIPSAKIAWLISAYTLPGILLVPAFGLLADFAGRRRTLFCSLLLFGCAGGACALARDFPLLVGLRVLQGIGAAAFTPSAVTLIGDMYEGGDRVTAMGLNTGVLSLGNAVFPAIGGVLALFSWRYPFALALLAIPVGLAVISLLDNPEPVRPESVRSHLAGLWSTLSDRRVTAFLLGSGAAMSLVYGPFFTFLPLYLDRQFGVSPPTIGFVFTAMALTTSAVASQLGRLSVRFSLPSLLKSSLVFYGLALLVIAMSSRLPWLVLGSISLGAAHGINRPTVYTFFAETATLEHRGSFVSVGGVALRVGQTVGPLLAGSIHAIAGDSAVFYAGAALALAALGMVVVLDPKIGRVSREPG